MAMQGNGPYGRHMALGNRAAGRRVRLDVLSLYRHFARRVGGPYGRHMKLGNRAARRRVACAPSLTTAVLCMRALKHVL